MPAYLVAYVDEVRDAAGLQQASEEASVLMARYGGRYLFGAFAPESLEGSPAPQAIAVAEFPSAEQFYAFWRSREYEPIRELRHRSASVRLLLAQTPPQAH